MEEHPAPKKESLKVETEAVIESRLDVELVSGSCGQTEGTGVVEGGWNAFPPNEDEDWGEPVKGGDWGDFSDLNRTVEVPFLQAFLPCLLCEILQGQQLFRFRPTCPFPVSFPAVYYK